MTSRSLLICILVALSASTKVTAAGLRGSGEESKKEDLTNGDEKLKPQKEQQSRRQLPPGQPNYGLTPSEHMRIYGWRDDAGYYGRYGWYDGGEYERGTYGNPWGEPSTTLAEKTAEAKVGKDSKAKYRAMVAEDRVAEDKDKEWVPARGKA